MGNDNGDDFFKIAAGLTGGVLLADFAKKLISASVEKPAVESERMYFEFQEAIRKAPAQRKWMMGIDTRKCIGCDSCSVACAAENVTPAGTSYRKVYKTESGDYKNLNSFFMPVNCQQCDEPFCMKSANKIMPNAIIKREDGIVVFNYEILKNSKPAQAAA